MFTFAYSRWLFFLLLIPLFIFLFLWGRFTYNKKLLKFGKPALVKELMPNVSILKAYVKFSLIMISLAAIIFALARPWGGAKDIENTREGIEIVIAVDASNSMLASSTDDIDGVSRMRTSKVLLEKLINSLGNDRVGLIEYAASAYTLIPITNDFVSAKAFLNSIEPSQIANQGTNIGEAVDLASKSFSDNKEVGKAIILLTDAEELENPSEVINIVNSTAKKGIQVNVIGIGDSPVKFKNESGEWMLDENGMEVETGLNEEMAVEIANAGNGIYVNASNDDAIPELEKQLGKLKKIALGTSFSVDHDELYIFFSILALIALIADFILTDSKNIWLDKIPFSNKNKILKIYIPLIFLSLNVLSSCDRNKEEAGNYNFVKDVTNEEARKGSTPEEFDFIMKGVERMQSENYMAADSMFLAALEKNNRSIVAPYNSGVAKLSHLLKMSQQQGEKIDSLIAQSLITSANDSFLIAANAKEKEGNISSQAFYNLGNLSFIDEQYDQAIELYKESLRLNPDDEHARRNLRIAQLKKKENDKQGGGGSDQQNQQNQDQQNQNQQAQPQRQENKINEQTTEQILEAAERKENAVRMRMKVSDPQNPQEGSYRSRKRW